MLGIQVGGNSGSAVDNLAGSEKVGTRPLVPAKLMRSPVYVLTGSLQMLFLPFCSRACKRRSGWLEKTRRQVTARLSAADRPHRRHNVRVYGRALHFAANIHLSRQTAHNCHPRTTPVDSSTGQHVYAHMWSACVPRQGAFRPGSTQHRRLDGRTGTRQHNSSRSLCAEPYYPKSTQKRSQWMPHCCRGEISPDDARFGATELPWPSYGFGPRDVRGGIRRALGTRIVRLDVRRAISNTVRPGTRGSHRRVRAEA